MNRTTFTLEERVAIAELVGVAELMVDEGGKPVSACHAGLGAILLERCANIVRCESKPFVFTNIDVIEFCKFWNTDERAAFNPLCTCATNADGSSELPHDADCPEHGDKPEGVK